MSTYLDVGVVRIQEYINRTAGAADEVLKRRRGASRMVRAATDLATFNALGRPNTETYDTEGVAHLVLHDGQDPASAAQRALALMRNQVRHAHLEASWAIATDYATAASLLARVREGEQIDDAGHFVSLPPVREDALAPRCTSCGSGVADEGGECVDCTERALVGARQRKASESAAPDTAEDEALARLGQELSIVPDLTKLARLPVPGVDKRNHLATIYADGNNIGGLFHSLRAQPDVARQVSILLDSTIKDAGDGALRQLAAAPQADAQKQFLPAVITTLAADDVVITVPAPWGWQFATTLIETFNRLIAERLGAEKVGVDVAPSLTAGMVFSHYKHPMEVAINRAAVLMRQAKKSERGRSAAIGWADLTQQSAGPGHARPIFWFTEHRSQLDALTALSGSQRGQLIHQLRQLRATLAAGSDREELAEQIVEYLLADARRTGVEGLLAPFLCSSPASRALDDLSTALAVAKWWALRERTGAQP